jgi:hypothetical protein
VKKREVGKVRGEGVWTLFKLIELTVFISINYQRFKDVFMSKREKIPKRVVGLDGVYSLKRLTEGRSF